MLKKLIYPRFHLLKPHIYLRLITCIYAINKISNPNELMEPNDIPELFSFLVANSYTIDTSITQMMQTSNVKMDNSILCFIK